MNILNVIKGFIGTHKLASIITASVVGVGAIGGTTAGVIHAVNNNDNEDTEVTTQANVNATDLTASALEGQEINLADLQGVTEEVQADGTTVIKDKNGTVVAKKDASGKTTLTKDGGVALSNGSVQASGNLANNVNNAQAQTDNYIASFPASNDNNVSYTASEPSPAPANNNYVAPSYTPSTPSTPTGCSHDYTPHYTTVHHDAEYDGGFDEPVYVNKDYNVCNFCGAKFDHSDREGTYNHMVEANHGSVSYHTDAENVLDHYEHRQTLIREAYDEQVIDYYYCSKCGVRM